MQPPIQVDADPMRAQVGAAIRDALLTLSIAAGVLGWTHVAGAVSGLMAAAGPVAGVAVFVWRQVVTRRHAQKAAAMADKLPNRIAVAK